MEAFATGTFECACIVENFANLVRSGKNTETRTALKLTDFLKFCAQVPGMMKEPPAATAQKGHSQKGHKKRPNHKDTAAISVDKNTPVPRAYDKNGKEIERGAHAVLVQSTVELSFTKELAARGAAELSPVAFTNCLRVAAENMLPRTEQYRDHKGSDAKLLQFLCEYIMTAPFMKKVARSEKMYGNKLLFRASRLCDPAADVIQRMYLRTKGSRMMKLMMLHVQQEKEKNKYGVASMLVGRHWRGFWARKTLRAAWRLSYKKFVQAESDGGQAYWENPVTGRTMWSKPWVLGSTDVELPIYLPEQDYDLTRMCDGCEEKAVTRFTLVGKEYFCTHCFDMLHSEKKKDHWVLKQKRFAEVTPCGECAFQMAAKKCCVTGDPFCDTCWVKFHSKGVLKKAKFEPMLHMCTKCEDKACTVKSMGQELCKPCFATMKREAAEKGDLTLTSQDIPFATVSADRRLQKIADDKEAKDRAEGAEKERQAWLCGKKDAGATGLQRVWRGSRVPRKGHKGVEPFASDFAKRRGWVKQKVEDEKQRQKRKYRVLDKFGKAPALKTDTALGRVLLRIPKQDRAAYEDALQGKVDELIHKVKGDDVAPIYEPGFEPPVKHKKPKQPKQEDPDDKGSKSKSKAKTEKKYDEETGLKVEKFKKLVSKSTKDGFQLPGTVTAKHGTRLLLTSADLSDRLRHHDRIRVVSKKFGSQVFYVVKIREQGFGEEGIPITPMWKFPDEKNLKVFRLPIAPPVQALKSQVARIALDRFVVQKALRGTIKVQALVARGFMNVAGGLDEDNALGAAARRAGERWNTKKAKNKAMTTKFMSDRDEAIRFTMMFAARRGAHSVAKAWKLKKKELIKRKNGKGGPSKKEKAKKQKEKEKKEKAQERKKALKKKAAKEPKKD